MTLTAPADLTGEQKTLLITLYGKAQESLLPDSLLHDRFAAEAVEKLDFDFSSLRLTRDAMIALANRSQIFDNWTAEFLAQYPAATVVHLGCGLDCRLFRVRPPAESRWFAVDFPEVIALRRQVLGPVAGCTLVEGSLTEEHWLRQIPHDQPTLVVAEGVLPYLPADEVFRLLRRLKHHFPGGEIVLDSYTRWGVRLLNALPSMRAAGAALQWSLNHPQDLETQVSGLRLETRITRYDPRQVARLSWPLRPVLRLAETSGILDRLVGLARYRF